MEIVVKGSSNFPFPTTAIPIPILTVESKHNITSHEKNCILHKSTNDKFCLLSKYLYLYTTLFPNWRKGIQMFCSKASNWMRLSKLQRGMSFPQSLPI